ncbi:SMI1/KNR4 family protein [Micromonospora sp. NIE79]|uniref:SMI1/KNR4 family protein n=1 Tax=Micromonospora trifolii TaxID=2911208 RepID=A0ABS9MV25_9ACTN|nr:SMI1/KNR4 family protein [Micromonospora trifolii]MCG5441313.1 SMI1/KNR4 family protein [Micromonospora trifolii]
MTDQLTWIDRIIDVTGWRKVPEDGVGWEQVEAQLGVPLPTDFKELCRRFVPGRFYAYLDLFRPTDDHAQPLFRAWAYSRQWPSEPDFARLWAPSTTSRGRWSAGGVRRASWHRREGG